jgi:hypothetical protein
VARNVSHASVMAACLAGCQVLKPISLDMARIVQVDGPQAFRGEPLVNLVQVPTDELLLRVGAQEVTVWLPTRCIKPARLARHPV